MQLWKKRIDSIAKNKHHYLVFEPPLGCLGGPDYGAIDELLTYAKEKLGEHRVIKDTSLDNLNAKITKIGFNPNEIKIHAYGEYGTECVKGVSTNLIVHLIPQKRVRQAVRILLAYSTDRCGGLYRQEDLRNPDMLETAKRDIRNHMKYLRDNAYSVLRSQ